MKWFKIFGLCVIMVLSIAGLASAAVTHVSPMDVYNYMQLDPSDDNYIEYLIDIRTPEEWCGDDYWDPRPGTKKGRTPMATQDMTVRMKIFKKIGCSIFLPTCLVRQAETLTLCLNGNSQIAMLLSPNTLLF